MSDINNQEGKKNIVDKIYDIPLDEYLDYVHQIPDATDQDVMDYYQKMVEAQKAQQTIQNEDIRDEEIREQLEKTVTAGKEAKQNLIESKLGLVADMAKKFVGQGTSVQNLIHEGNQGVAHAVENLVKNNPDKFNGMIPTWIRERMEKAVESDEKFKEESSKEE